jgi:AmmeMemoRadiSam system protein A
MDDGTHPYVKLARQAIRHYAVTGELLQPEAAPGDPPPSGVFVSLHEPPSPGVEEGPLRGCIGSWHPREHNLRAEIARSAVAAAYSDPRFPPLESVEIDRLHITVYLLAEPERVNDMADLDPAKFGVMVEGPGGRRGLLLPGIRQIRTASQQLEIAMQKAGLSPQAKVRTYRFAATIIE